MTFETISVSHPRMLLLALVLAAAAAGALLLRRNRARPRTVACGLAAMLLLSLAAGGIQVDIPAAPRVAVMVDLSPSTRGAPWRNPAYVREVAQRLAPGAVLEIHPFADGRLLDSDAAFSEIATTRTLLPAVAGDAVLLFSDGQLSAPELMPPLYVVHTPWTPEDARIQRLSYAGEVAQAYIINESARGRRLRWGESAETLAPGSSRIFERPVTDARLEARLEGGDAWPENDVASLPPPLSPRLQQWWLGSQRPPNFTGVSALPKDIGSFLQAGLIVLCEVSPDSLSPGAEEMLVRYVADLGGSVLLICGDAPYSAWRNRPLTPLLPLMPDPPEARRRWTVLVDASGSMATRIANQMRWQQASQAAMQLLRGLPGQENVSIASFSSAVRWLEAGRPVREVLGQPPAFGSVVPSGSTDLEPALLELSRQGGQDEPAEILVLTDAQVSFQDMNGLIVALQKSKARVSILALDEGGGVAALRRLAETTGGVFLQQAIPARWVESAGLLASAASPSRQQHAAARLRWQSLALPSRDAVPWNLAWAREGANVAAFTLRGEMPLPLVAQWHAGLGAVAVAVTPLTAQEVQGLARELMAVPADPSLQVDWGSAADGLVRVRATLDAKSINGLRLSLGVVPLEGQRRVTADFEQIAAGEYRCQWAPLAQPALASVYRNGRPAARSVLAGQAAPEFLHLGVDTKALADLARRSGGGVVEADNRAIRLPVRREPHLISPVVGVAGVLVLLVTAALLRRENT